MSWHNFKIDLASKTIVEWLLILAIALMVAGTPFAVYYSAKLESEAFNRLTGAHTTAWDAIWLELRVQDAPAK